MKSSKTENIKGKALIKLTVRFNDSNIEQVFCTGWSWSPETSTVTACLDGEPVFVASVHGIQFVRFEYPAYEP